MRTWTIYFLTTEPNYYLIFLEEKGDSVVGSVETGIVAHSGKEKFHIPSTAIKYMIVTEKE